MNNIFQEPMQPWPALKPFGKTITLSSLNVDLFFYEAGQENQNTILMIHGLGDEADTWRHIFLPLSEIFHVIALDLPGFGRSQKTNRDYSVAFFEKSLLGLIENLKIVHPILLGSSLGGILSHHLALSNPSRFLGLILVGGALNQDGMEMNLFMRLMQIPLLGEWLYTRLRKDPQAAFDSLQSVYYDLNNLPEIDRNFLFTRVNQRVWDDGQKHAYFSTLRNLFRWRRNQQPNLINKLMKLDIPTLVVRGEYDQLFSSLNGLAVTKKQPEAQMRQIQGAGHLPHQENPSKFLNEVNDWLSQQIITNKV